MTKKKQEAPESASDARITAEEFGTWLPASVAINTVIKGTGDWTTASSSMLQRLGDGLIRSCAEHAIEFREGETEGMKSLVSIPLHVWQFLSDEPQAAFADYWRTNDAIVQIPDSHSPLDIVLKLYGIRMDPSGVQKMVPTQIIQLAAPPASVQPKQSEQANKGGRPRKEFWDDLLIAMFVKIWNGELTPQSQADIERAMLDWAQENGEQLGDTSVKGPAKKLFRSLKQ
jgi:hypothetical protein